MRKFRLMIVLIMCLLTAGCSKKQGEFKPLDTKGGSELIVLTGTSLRADNTYCSAEDGCYSYSGAYEKQKGCNVFFSDYKTRQKVYLSSSVNGDYWSENDTSYFKNATSMGICKDEDSLYIYATEMLEDASFQNVLYRMDLNGENRQELFRKGENITIVGGMLSDKKYIYFLLSEIMENGEANILCAIEKENGGEIKEIYRFSNDVKAKILVSGFDRKIVFKEINLNDVFENQQHKILVFDLDTGEEIEIMSWKQDEIVEIYDEQYVYYIDVKNECIIEKDLLNDEEKVLWDKIPFELDRGSLSVDEQLYDNCIIVYTAGKRYAMNIETKEVIELSLVDESNGGYLSILGASEDEYMVCYDMGERRINIENPKEGMTNEEIISYYKYAMIKKEDFYNNRPNYIMIEDMEIDKDSIVS